MISARHALQEAYSVFLSSPEQEAFVAPRKGHKIARAKPRRVIRAPQSAPNAGEIIETPAPRVTGTETFTGRTSTNHRNAVLAFAAPIIAAAENQPDVFRLWLRWAYDPFLDTNTIMRNQIRAQLLELVFCLWCYAPKQRRPDIDNPVRLVRFVDLMLSDLASRFKNGSPRRVRRLDGSVGVATCDDNAKFLGYRSAEDASWWRSWGKHEQDLYRLVDEIDRVALQPVVEVLHAREERQEAERANSLR